MMAGFFARMRSLWGGVRRRSQIEADIQEEFQLHLELRSEDLMRFGLSPAEARRRARREFGNPARYQAEARASRGLHRIDALRFSWLDFKLGFRMLARYPGLTVIGGLAIAFAVWMGAGTYEVIGQFVNPKLPLPDGDRLVGIQVRNTLSRDDETRILHDFVRWRGELESIADVSAYRTVERNLQVREGYGEPVDVAEINAAAFRAAGVQPLLGRLLLDSDELEGADPVVVIGHEVWQTRFAGDRSVIGRRIRVSNVQGTVVGVMPKGFGFPLSHDIWIPLRFNVLNYARLQGPSIRVLGRLTPGATLDQAQSELDYIGLRAAADFPDTHEHLRPRVVPYAHSMGVLSADELAALPLVNLFVVMLVALVCGNVGLLMLARAATRESEIVVRSALGASRGRIVAQLFVEALVLGSLGATAGLAVTAPALRWAMFVLEANLGELPFWIDHRISPATMLYAAGLTVLGAVVAGVLPALRVTRGLGARLRELSAGGGGLKFSGVWTVIIITQVAVTVAFPATAFFLHKVGAPLRSMDVGFAAEQYASVRLELDSENAAGQPAESRAEFLARFRRTYQELERRLRAEPGVDGVTFADRLPRMVHGTPRLDVVEGIPLLPNSVFDERVHTASVADDYFDVLGAPIIVGRSFDAADLESDHRVVIVNQSFVAEVLQGRNPVSRRLRFANQERDQEPGPWYEIVGVAKDLGMNYLGWGSGAGLYFPLTAHNAGSVYMAVKARGDPELLGPRLRAVAHAVDPTLRLYEFQPMHELQHGALAMLAIYLRMALLMSSIALLLSLAGIYAVMSFAVSRRTREIGIRVALGADALRIMLSTFARPLAHVAVGILVGGWLVAGLTRSFLSAARSSGELSVQEIGLVVAYAALMFGVCMLACIVPARRALAVQPAEALGAE